VFLDLYGRRGRKNIFRIDNFWDLVHELLKYNILSNVAGENCPTCQPPVGTPIFPTHFNSLIYTLLSYKTISKDNKNVSIVKTL